MALSSPPSEPALEPEGPWVCCEAWKVIHPHVSLVPVTFYVPLSPGSPKLPSSFHLLDLSIAKQDISRRESTPKTEKEN